MKKFKISNLIFVTVFSIALLTGLVFVIVAPKDTNEYENRTAEKMKEFTLSSYMDGSFQDSIESALADQIPYSETFKQFYNIEVSKFTAKTLNYAISKGGKAYVPGGNNQEPEHPTENPEYAVDIASLSKSEIRELESFDMTLAEIYPKSQFDPNASYFKIGKFSLWQNHLIGDMTYPEEENIEAFASMFNSFVSDNPECKFAAFFLENDTDMHFLTGERTEYGQALFSKLNIPEENKAILKMHSFQEFDELFFKTDHHWNHKGSNRGYKAALAAVLPEEKPLEVIDEFCLGTGNGSKAMTDATASYKEKFYIYEYDFPEMNVSANNGMYAFYGNENNYVSEAKAGKQFERLTYGEIWGWDYAEVIVDRLEDTGKGNILVVGNSYDNSVIKLLASHFDCLYSLDFRHYYNWAGSFDMKEYIENKNISTVLFFGDSIFYKYNAYMVN